MKTAKPIGKKVPNINIILTNGLNSVKTVFFNNTGTSKVPFMLSPYEAEYIVEKIVNCLAPRAVASHRYDTADGEITLEVANNGLALVKKLNNGAVYAYNLSFQNPDSLKLELLDVLAILRFYSNIEQIRNIMVDFMNREFGSCTCRDMDAKKMGLIVANEVSDLI